MIKICPICKTEFEPKHLKRKYCDECKAKYGNGCSWRADPKRYRQLQRQWLYHSEKGKEYREKIRKKQNEWWVHADEKTKEHVRALNRARYRRLKKDD